MKNIYRVWILLSALFVPPAISAQPVVDRLLSNALNVRPLSPLLPAAPLEVIVSFSGSGPATDTQLKILRDLGISRGIAFRSFPIVGVLATAAQVRALENNPSVRSLYLNSALELYNDYSTELIGVDRLRADSTMIENNGGIPVTGNGIGVLVNDSGVDGTHADIAFGEHLVQNVLGSLNLAGTVALLPPTYVENLPTTDANSGHGTHCTGTIGGTGQLSSGKYEGVAPGADLVGYGSGAVLLILDALGGLDYAATHRQQYGIRVVSNSWGTSGAFDPSDPINIATKTLFDQGIVTVFAAGNEGPAPGTLNPYSLAPWVISVAAGDRDRQLASFSSRGVEGDQSTITVDGQTWLVENRPTLTAPGVDIVSTRAVSPLPVLSTDQDLASLDPAHVPYYTHMSGTSMATPHVSGVVALMLEANPSLSPGDIKDILQFTSLPMPGIETWEAGWGYLDAFNAVGYAFAIRPSTGVESAVSLTGSPNPSSNEITLTYTVPDAGLVNVVLLDNQGNRIAAVVDEYREKGAHQVSISKSELNLAPGLYVAKMNAGGRSDAVRLQVR